MTILLNVTGENLSYCKEVQNFVTNTKLHRVNNRAVLSGLAAFPNQLAMRMSDLDL